MINTEMFKEKIEKPKTRGAYADVIDEFIKSENKTLRFNCSSVEEAKKCYASCGFRNKKLNLGLVVWKKNNQVYLIKG